MAQEREMTPSMVSRMAALHGIALDPQRLETVARDLDVSIRKLEEVTRGALMEVEPAFIGPLQLPAPTRPQRRQR